MSVGTEDNQEDLYSGYDCVAQHGGSVVGATTVDYLETPHSVHVSQVFSIEDLGAPNCHSKIPDIM